MMLSATSLASTLPTAIVDAVNASIDKRYSVFFSEKPFPVTYEQDQHRGPCIAGIISFIGEMPWSLSWVLPKETAPAVAQRFAGFEIPYDSADMGDVAGELVNVIAGEIVAQLEQRKIKSHMTLPTVARGSPVELVPERGPSIVHLEYTSKEGPFWFRIEQARHHLTRLSGK